MSVFETEVMVIGAGPTGSAAAAMLARAGAAVMLLESETFPRFHIGESLLPLSNRVFDELGLTQKIRSAGFMEKWGAVFFDAEGKQEIVYDFGNLSGLGDLHTRPTYQVPRAQFDALLLEHARACGAQIMSGRAESAEFLKDGVIVCYKNSDGKTGTVRAHAIIDASGRGGFLAKRFNLRVPDKALQKAAVYSHFRGVSPMAGRLRGSIRIVSSPSMDWMWFIPLSEDVMSVGVVCDIKRFQQVSGAKNPQAIFETLIHEIPMAERLLENAVAVMDFQSEGSFSYTTKNYAGDRWLLAGDAGSFLDPVFSSGVLFGLLGGCDAARCMLKSLEKNRFDGAHIAAYHREQIRRYRFVRRFVVGFYEPALRDLFYSPRDGFGMTQAVLKVLAGAWSPTLKDQIGLGAFFAAARCNRYLPLVPRLH